MSRRSSPLLMLSLLAGSAAAQLVVPTAQYPTIQSAIDAATTSQIVRVLPGTYAENIDLKGKDITVQSLTGAAATTIDGTQSGPTVAFTLGSTRACVFEGFTVINGLARTVGTFTNVGGGILVNACSPTIRNCTVRNNRSNGYGGGIGGVEVTSTVSAPVSPLIQNCLIENNAAQGAAFASGGGIALLGSGSTAPTGLAEIRNCLIRNNAATTRGAGSYFGYNQNATIDSCVFTGNTALMASGGLDGGGAIFMALNAVCVITNNRIFGNSSVTNGGAIKFFNVTGASIVNNTIVNNTGGAIAGIASAALFGLNVSVNVVNCIVYGNGATEFAFTGVDQMMQPPKANVSYSDVAGGFAGTGNFNTPPLVANVATDNHRLLPGSPCINTGNNAAANVPAQDFEGDVRPIGGTVDVGADEYNPAAALLYANRGTIPVSNPGTTGFTILGGSTRAGYVSVLLAGLSGTRPGADIGALHLPLNVDASTSILLSGFSSTFVTLLNGSGTGTSSLPLGTTPIPEMLGARISFAAALITPGLVLNAFTNDETLVFVP